MPRNILLGRAHRWPGACDDFHRITLVGEGWKARHARHPGEAVGRTAYENCETNPGCIPPSAELRNEPSNMTSMATRPNAIGLDCETTPGDTTERFGLIAKRTQ